MMLPIVCGPACNLNDLEEILMLTPTQKLGQLSMRTHHLELLMCPRNLIAYTFGCRARKFLFSLGSHKIKSQSCNATTKS